MSTRRIRSKAPLFEALEGRELLTTVTTEMLHPAPVREVASMAPLVRPATASPTTTTLAASLTNPILGQFVTLTATVRATSRTGTVPTGVVQFADGKTVLGTAKLYSGGHSSLAVSTLFYGKHTITATYLGDGKFAAGRSASLALTVKHGPMKALPDGLQIATVRVGSGPGAVAGQALSVNYVGYLLGGSKFDTTMDPGGKPFNFYLGNKHLMPGWNEGLTGIKVGEQRVLVIPSALGFGTSGQGTVPPNVTLVYIVQLVKFLAPKIVVTGGSNVQVTDHGPPTAANRTSFGGIKVGGSGDAIFTVTNAGDDALRFKYTPVFAQISGEGAGDFIITHSLLSSTSAQFTVSFRPKSAGLRTATVTIPSNDPRFPMFRFTVEGTGV